MEPSPVYTVKHVEILPSLTDSWDDNSWKPAQVISVDSFRQESSSHHPRTQARLMYSTAGLHGIFQVHDQYVRAARVGFQSEVWKDSCVEIFVQPKAGKGYINFEMNCGGSLLCTYVTDPTRLPGGALKQCTRLPESLGRSIQVRSTLPQRVDPELTQPTVWQLSYFIPFAVFEPYVGPVDFRKGSQWRVNFFKCAEDVSHPHWASWAPVPQLNFHLPQCFGKLVFG